MKLILGIISGVAHMHSLGIVHRDLKPANILLTKDHLPKISDFGLAKFELADKSSKPHATKVGTPAYIPKEVILGDVKLLPQIDIYALGFIFYQLIFFESPFPKNSRALQKELYVKGWRAPFPDDFNPELKNLISALWADKPEERPDAYNVFVLLRDPRFLLPDVDEEEYFSYYRELSKVTNPTLPPEMKIKKVIADRGDMLEQYNMYKYITEDDQLKEVMKQEALDYLEASADQKFPISMYTLAEMIKDKDPKRAYRLMKKAADKMYIPAIFMQGIYERDGIGFKKDHNGGKSKFIKAGEFGFIEGYIVLAEMRVTGNGIRQDVSEAKKLFSKIKKSDITPELYERYNRLEELIENPPKIDKKNKEKKR